MDDVHKTLTTLRPEVSFDDIKNNEEDVLFRTSLAGYSSAVDECLTQGTDDTNRHAHKNRSSVMVAAWRGDWTIYEVLLSSGAELTSVDEDCNNILHLAAEGGNEAIVVDLLSWNLLAINSPGYLGRTALHIAALHNNEKVFGALLSAGADLSLLDSQGNNCLHLAVEGSSRFIVKNILSMSVLDVNSRGFKSYTAVMMAIMKGSMDIVDILVSNGADLSIKTENNNDCLVVAVVKGRTPMLRMLLEMEGPDINCRGQHGRTPVMIAALLGKSDEFDILVSAKADVSVHDNFGNDCLMLASVGGNIDIVQNLMSLDKFNINRQQENGATPVLAAASCGNSEVFEFLIAQGADVSTTCFGNNCLITACEGGNVDIVFKIFSEGYQDINQHGQNGWTPIMIAAKKGDMEIFKLLDGADLALVDDYSNNCLILASMYGQIKMVEHLLSIPSGFDVNWKGQRGMSAIMTAAHEGNEEVFSLLVEAGADLTITDDNGSNCLILASIGGSVSIVQHLLEKKALDLKYRNKDGWTALLAAAATGNKNVFEHLVGVGADVSVTDRDNNNCLMLACIGGNSGIVRYLISKSQFDINVKGCSGFTSAMYAAFYGKIVILGMLMAAGADVHLTDDFNDSCLTLATANGHIDIVKLLLKEDTIDVNHRGRKGCTPILLAAHGGQKALLELLLEHGGDLSAMDDNSASFRHYATNNIKAIDNQAIKKQLLAELRGGSSFIRTGSIRGSFRGSFIGKEEPSFISPLRTSRC